jgi:hypothetical protein
MTCASFYRDAMQGRINIVIAPGMEMAESFTAEELSQGFVGRRHGTEEGLAVVVPDDGGARQFADLRGKRVVRLSNDRLAESFLEIQCRQQTGLPCADLFQTAEEKRDIQSIHRVFFGQADAALVSLGALQTARELNPQVARRIRVLLEWKTSALSFGMMTARSSPEYRELVLRAALQAARTMRGKQILELFKVDYMEQVGKTELLPYWRLSRELQGLMKTKSTRKS